MFNGQKTYKYLKIFTFQAMPNWSAIFIQQDKFLFHPNIKSERIGNLIKRVKTPIEVKDNIKYKRAKIKLYHGGISVRDEKLGKNIGTKRQFLIKEGQFLLSKIDARNGAFGVVSPDLEGGIVTGNFWTFEVDYSKLYPLFLSLLASTEVFQKICQAASAGTTGRHYLQQDLFLNFKIPLPPIIKQKKLANAYWEKINLAKETDKEIEKIEAKLQQFLQSTLGIKRKIQKHDKKIIYLINYKSIDCWGVDKILRSETFISSKFDMVNLVGNPYFYIEAFRGKSPKYDFKGTKLILNQKCNRWNEINFGFAKKVNDNWYNRIDKKYFTQEGDIIINSTGEGTIGRATYIKSDYSGWLYDSHVLLLRLNTKKINPEFFTYLFNSNYGQEQIANLKSAKSTKQTELGIQNLLKIPFPVLSIKEQSKIVEMFKGNEIRVKGLKNKSEKLRSQAISDFEKAIFKTKETA